MNFINFKNFINFRNFFLWILLFFSSCTGLMLGGRVMISKDDWIMCGGNSLQQNTTNTILEPPFDLKWTYDFDAGIGNSGITIADGVLFVNDLAGELVTIDVPSGGRLGAINFLGSDANTAPLILQDKIVVAYAGDNKYSLACYDLLSRVIIWKINLGYLQTSPILYEDNIYVGSLNGNEYKIDLDGHVKWTYDTKSQIHSTCAVDSNKVVFGADNGYVYCLNTDYGIEEWKFKTGGSVVSTPLIYNRWNKDAIFFGSYDSIYYALTLDSGNVIWEQNLKTKIYSGSALYKTVPIIQDDILIRGYVVFGGIDENLYFLDIFNDGRIVRKFQTNGVITCTPLVSGNYVYFTSYDWYVYCVDGYHGKIIWNYKLDGKGRTTPLVWKNYLFVPADRYVYCFMKK